MSMTRREWLGRLALAGGAGTAFAWSQALALTRSGPEAARFALPSNSGKGRRVAVLGAGIAGLVAAYELEQAGYSVTLLEARDRIGGRVWTVRGGDAVAHLGHEAQRAGFSNGLYFNAGAARIPQLHHAILGYARRLGVPLEVFVNTNRSARWDFGGQVREERQMVNDLHGRVYEMLAKAIDRKALDDEMPAAELARFRRYLGEIGGLDDKGRMVAWGSSGHASPPGASDRPGVPAKSLSLRELLPVEGMTLPFIFEAIADMQATMLQPVGGMDAIARALAARVTGPIRLDEPVRAIRREGEGVRIEHRSGATRADFCVCTLPANLLARLDTDFSPAKKAALKDIDYLASAKVAFEAPRFWERDDHIYGGVGWTDRLNENVVYPSGGFHQDRGVLVGAYVAGWTHRDTPQAFVKLPFAEQVRISRDSIEAMHPGKGGLLEKPVVVNWGAVPFSEGVGAVGRDFGEARRGARYDELLRPEGPVVFAGEHLSYVGLWQEGSALSAHDAVTLLHEKAASARAPAA